MKKRIGIVAKKLSHSISPIIHNAWLKKHKINAEYVCFELKENELEAFYRDFSDDRHFLGFNITVPYKEAFFHMCNNVSKEAKSIGAINLVYKRRNKIYGDNTDYVGFAKTYKLLIHNRINNILVIGAGGAAKSILKFLNDQKIRNVDVIARTTNKKQSLSRLIKLEKFYTDINLIKGKRYDLIINASDAGTQNKKLLNNNIYKMIPKASYVIDIVYNPVFTKFLTVAHNSEIQYQGGLNMLLEQAKPSFDSWFGTDVQITKYLKNKLIKGLNTE